MQGSFAGGPNSRGWGRAGPGRPHPDLPARFQSHWLSAGPGPWDSLNIFTLSSRRFSSSSRFHGRDVLVSPRPEVSSGSRSLSTIGVQSSVCHAPIPAFRYRWVPRGLRGALITRISSHYKCHESWFFLTRKIGIMIAFFVLNRDMNNHDPWQKDHEPSFCLFVRWP